MIAGIASGGATITQAGGRPTGRGRLRTAPRRDERPAAPEAKPRPESAPRRAQPPLDDIQRPAAPLPAPARATAAARAFSAGNGYVTGLLVDRII